MSAHRYRRFFGRRSTGDVDAELQFHADMLVEEYLRAGMTLDEARIAAQAGVRDLEANRLEGVAINTRVAHRERFTAWLGTIAEDIRFAGRMLARDKAWTALAVLTVGLGIGANSALFAIVNAVLIRPLPYVDPGRIMSITVASRGAEQGTTSETIFHAWASRAHSFTAIAAYRPAETTLRGIGGPELAAGRRVTHGWDGLLRTRHERMQHDGVLFGNHVR